MTIAVLHDLPMPARLAPWPRARQTTLVRCLWLAVLLHLWALLSLGSAPQGTALPGQGVQGRLNVTLRGPADEGPSARPPQAPLPQAGPTAADAPTRLGGAVRDSPLPAGSPPGAARLGPQPAAALPPAPAAVATPKSASPPPALLQRAQQAPLPVEPTPEPTPEGRLDAGSLRPVRPSSATPLAAPAPVALPAPLPLALPSLAAGPSAAGPLAAESPAAAAATAATSALPTDTGPRLGADVAVPATAASAPRVLKLELGRLRGGELSRHGTAGLLPVLPRPPETDKLAAEIEKAARTDCRTAHAGTGVLAVVPLVVDAVRGKGCKW